MEGTDRRQAMCPQLRYISATQFIRSEAIRTGILLKFGSVAAATMPKLPNSNPIEARHDMYILPQKHLQTRSKKSQVWLITSKASLDRETKIRPNVGW